MGDMPLVLYDPVVRRAWLCGRRLHHGAVGVVVMAAGLVVGAALMIHDRADWREWRG